MKSIKLLVLLLLSTTIFSSCELVGDIFQAGMWIGVIIVIAIIALILWLLRKIRK